ncbi:MAG: helix-turn-helix transcriptional regulator [Bacteroidota bacterium]
MENLIGNRIKCLRSAYNLGLKDFASYCGLSHVAIFHLESGKTAKPHRNSIQRIANNFGTTTNWLLYGEDCMLPNGKAELDINHNPDFSDRKESAFEELKNTNRILEQENERLWQLIQNMQVHSHKSLEQVKEAV